MYVEKYSNKKKKDAIYLQVSTTQLSHEKKLGVKVAINFFPLQYSGLFKSLLFYNR